jgi:hypothetical protein
MFNLLLVDRQDILSEGTPRFDQDQFGLSAENVDVAKQVDLHQGAFSPMRELKRDPLRGP